LLRQAAYKTAEINEIANMALVSGGTNRKIAKTPAEEYLKGILDKRDKDALEAHCIPLDQSLWKMEAYPQFLEYRRAALAKLINDFITDGGKAKSKAGVEALVKNIGSVLAQGESNTIEFKSSARWDCRTQ
jgi:hypothetical protein